MPVFSAYWAFDFLLEIVEFAYENKTTEDLLTASARVGEGNRESALHKLARSLNYSEKEKETYGMKYALQANGFRSISQKSVQKISQIKILYFTQILNK